MKIPFFSIVLFADKVPHLLSLTLDTLKQQSEKDFEVILLGEEKTGRLKELVHQYPELDVRIEPLPQGGLSNAMNAALFSAKGKYVQFLSPGDRFLSQDGLTYVRALIAEEKEPHFIYGAFLQKNPDSFPRVISYPLTLQALQEGGAPPFSRASWFLRKAALETGGFDLGLSHRLVFDLLCRMFQKPGLKAVLSRRVLTDSEPEKIAPKQFFGYLFETCRILRRHFGLWHAVRWIFVQDHLKMVRSMLRLIKGAFFKEINI